VTQGLDWHWIFWVNVPIGLVVAGLSASRLAESRGPTARLDLPAVGLVSGGAIFVVWGLVRANDVGWRSPEIVAALGIGVALLAGLVAWERRAAEPMLPPRLFRSRPFVAANVTSFLMTGGLFAGAFLVSQYLQLVLGSSPLAAGLRFLPMTGTPLLIAPAAGVLSDRVGRRPVLVVGMLLLGGGLAWVALAAGGSGGYRELVIPLLVAGVGASMSFATAPTAALSAVAPSDVGKASGTNNTLQRFGSAFGIAATTAVLGGGFRPALAMAAALALLGAISALGVAGRRRVVTPAAAPAAGGIATARSS
jgi:MFS family permease